MRLSVKEMKERLKKPNAQVEPLKQARNFAPFPANRPLDWEQYRVEQGLWYFPNYISSDLEGGLLGEILEQPASTWVPLRGRRLQNWGGIVTSAGLYQPSPLPSWLSIFSQRLLSEGLFPTAPNHALINDYLPGEGIMPHTDGPAYFPKVAIVSLGADTAFQFWSLGRVPSVALRVEARSLLVFSELYYTDLLHGIEAKGEDVWLADDCGKVYTEASGLLSEARNVSIGNGTVSIPTEYQCPNCLGSLSIIGTNIRGRRISMTIRVVPPFNPDLAPDPLPLYSPTPY